VSGSCIQAQAANEHRRAARFLAVMARTLSKRMACTGIACGGADAAFKPGFEVRRPVANGAPEADKSWSTAVDSKLFEGGYCKVKVLCSLHRI
jgi:hypothetical protein